MSAADLLIVLAALAIATVHGAQIATLVSGALALRREQRSAHPGLRQAAAGAGALPGISAIVAAEGGADDTQRLVDALANQHYPDLEIIIVVDGATSPAFEAWTARGALRVTDPPARNALPTEHVRAVLIASDRDNLLVVDKRGDDAADRLNAGLNLASRPLVLSLAPGALPGPRALLEAALPFALDPSTTVSWAAPEAVDLSAAATTDRHQLVASIGAVRRSRRRLESLAVTPTAASTLAPFTLALFRRDVVLQHGGFEPYAPAPEAALVRRLQTPHLVQPGAVAVRRHATEGWPALAADMALDTPLARAAAIVEACGWLLVIGGVLSGAAAWSAAILFASAALGLGLCASLTALLVDAIDGHATPATPTVAWFIAAAAIEQLGPRQLAAWSRLRTWLSAPRHATA